MPEFIIIDEKRYALNVERFNNVDLLPYYRFEHRVTVGYRGRRFMAFIDNGDASLGVTPTLYIEELTAGNLKRIEDDSMFEAIYRWIEPQGFLGMFKPLPKLVRT